MDVLFPAVYQALSEDVVLGNLSSSVRQFRAPEDPSKLVKPVVVFIVDDNADELGLHGAATNPEIEVNVWGYGASMFPDCVKAAQRVSEIFLGSSGPSPSTGALLRWREVVGWQRVPVPDDNEGIRLRAVFRTRYWSRGRIEAVSG